MRSPLCCAGVLLIYTLVNFAADFKTIDVTGGRVTTILLKFSHFLFVKDIFGSDG